MKSIRRGLTRILHLFLHGRLEPAHPEEAGARPRRIAIIRRIVLTPSLLFGLVIVIGLAAAVLIGPLLAPYNPYLSTQRVVEHYDSEAGEFVRPPLPASPDYPLGTDPWGRDTLSLLLYGARNTLIAAGIITIVRMIVGLGIGTAAGWNEGSTFDRLAMSGIGIITSLPMLISSMILIFGIGIQRGFAAFIIALTLIGWTEIAQYVRSEMIVMRERGFVEGARSLGMDELAVAIRHALPNITPQTVVLTFLEMGAVMMLIGELAFVGLFIDGGSRVAIDRGLGQVEFFTVADIPEWGAMLATGFRHLRAAPFVILPPALAFFLATIGFNALGEGLRTLFEESGIGTAFLLRRGTVLGIAAACLGGIVLMNQTGPIPWYSRLARTFEGQSAYRHVAELTGMAGRGLGQPGADQAAAYILERFQEYGLQPGGRNRSYTFDQPALLIEPSQQPQLRIGSLVGDLELEYQHQVDFGYQIAGRAGAGEAAAPLTMVTFLNGPQPLEASEFKGLDLRERIVVVLGERHPANFLEQAIIHGARAMIVIQPDDLTYPVSQRIIALNGEASEASPLDPPGIPVFHLRPEPFQRALDRASQQLSELAGGQMVQSDKDQVWTRTDLPLRAALSVRLQEARQINIPSVIGYLPGTDADVAHQLVAVVAHYDGLGVDHDGTIYPAADAGASGIGVMLELARSWNDQQFVPGRSLLLLAWGGGASGGPGIQDYLENPDNFVFLRTAAITHAPMPTNIFYIGRVGSGSGILEAYPTSPGGPGLALELEAAAERSRTSLAVIPTAGEFFIPDSTSRNTPGVFLQRAASAVAPDQDRLERIEPGLLEQAGRLLSLSITQVATQSGN